jgi:hypothetical protein
MNTPEDNDFATEYCNIIMKDADKVNDLVINMLEQSLYESGAQAPQRENFSVDE